MPDRGRFAWIVALAGIGACQPVDAPATEQRGSEPDAKAEERKDEPAAHGAVTPVPSTPSPADAIPDSRRCGEAGPSPTPLPPALAIELGRVGAGELGPGESETFGTVVVKYATDAWLGSRTSGHRGEALEVVVDRAEVGDGPWGTQHPLRPNDAFAFEIGPYRFAGSTSMGDPPARVTIAIERRSCPDHAVMDDPAAKTWVWVSTDALRAYTLQRKDQSMLQVVLVAVEHQPRMELRFRGWHHSFTPTPGRMPSFRADDRTLTVEEVVPGAGSTYTDKWSADGIARAHARVRIEPAEPIAIDPAVPAPTACGEAGAVRTELPAALATTPATSKDLRMSPGAKRRAGALELELVARVIEHPGWRREPEREEYRDLLVRGADASATATLTFRGAHDAQYARVGELLVRADEAPPSKALRVRMAELACPGATNIHSLSGPTYVWLSTIGHEKVTLGAGVHPRLTLQLYADLRSPSLGISSEHALYSSQLGPSLVGQAFTMDSERVQIVDVVAGADTKDETWAWSTTALVPTLHVQVRIDPSE